MRIKISILQLVKLCFFIMLLYSSFLMDVMNIRIANMTLFLGMLTVGVMVLDMFHSPYGFVTIMTADVQIMFVFIIFSVLGTVFASFPDAARNGLIQLLQCIMLMMVTIYICIRDGSVTFCAKAVVIVMAIATIYALMNAQSFDYRLSLTEESNANVFGHNAVLGIGLSAIAFENGKRFRRLMVLALGVIFVAGVLFSASRMSFITLVGYLVGYLIYYVPRKDSQSIFSGGVKFIGALIVTVGLAVFLSSYFSNTLLADRMYELVNVFDTGTGDGKARIYLYKTAWEEFLRYPLFGLGYANFAPLHYGVYTHSTYAEILSCTGIFGFLTFMVYYLHIFKELRKGTKRVNSELQKTNRLLLLLFVSLLLLGVGEILIYKIKYFIVYGMLAAQIWLNGRYGIDLDVKEPIGGSER